MLFNSLAFAIFFPIVLLGYYSLRLRVQNVWLVVASYIFYGWWDARFLILIWISTLVDYHCAIRISETGNAKVRRRWLITSVVTNLGILGFFKYFNFFVGSAAGILSALGLHANIPVLRVVLPVGISFYTFQTMAYTIDVYRGKGQPTRDLLSFALYVCYFPQLVAGPIERATRLLPQIQRERTVDWVRIRQGLVLILIGLFKKVGIADSLAHYVDVRFSNPDECAGLDLLYALYFFSVQIYCDFSGYSSIARGTSKLLGIDLMVNFKQPYFSASITEFWRRWHISLSSWLRDYLYIPLGGNRHGTFNTYRNLMLTMLLGGLWHGANWTFVVWGGLHGLYLSVHKFAMSFVPTKDENNRHGVGDALIYLVKVLIVFHLVSLTWIFFRSASFTTAWHYLTGILSWQAAGGIPSIGVWPGTRIMLLLAMLFVIDVAQYRSDRQTILLDYPWPVRGFTYAAVLVLLFAFGGFDAQVPFIYFQF